MVPAGVGAQRGQCLLPTAGEVRLVLQLTGEAGDEPVLGTDQVRKGFECQVGNPGIWPPSAGREHGGEAPCCVAVILKADIPPTPSSRWPPTCPQSLLQGYFLRAALRDLSCKAIVLV